MICLDTNIVIELFKGRPDIVSELQRHPADTLCISAIVAAELYQGAFDKAELKAIKGGIARFTLLPLQPAIGERMLELMQQHVLSHRMKMPDALIAATALHHDLPLYTLNLKDFRYIPGLRLHPPATA